MWGDASDILYVVNFLCFLFVIRGRKKNTHGIISCYRISLRGTETPNLFNFVIAGRNVNYDKLVENEAELKNCFYENTGRRSDLKFLEIPWMSQYTCVDSFHLY
jgi:hypothetical protein